MENTNLNPHIQGYLNHCQYEKCLDTKTLKAYKIDLEQFDMYIKDTGGNYNKESIQAYIASLYGMYSVKSVKRKIASVKAFFNYLEFEELIKINPFSKIRVKLHEPYLLPRTIPLTTINCFGVHINSCLHKIYLHINIELTCVILQYWSSFLQLV